MRHTILDITRQYFKLDKTVIHRASPWKKTIFWRTPFFSDQDAHNILSQWNEIHINQECFKSKRYRFVFTDIKLKINERIFIPKIYKVRKIGQNIAAVLFSEAERNSATLAYLHENGVDVPVPLGVLNSYTCGYLTDSILFQERLPLDCVPYKQFQTNAAELDDAVRLDFFHQLGASLGRVHALGIYTEDTDQNMMVEKREGSRFRLHYFDFDNFYPWRYPTLRRTDHAIRHYTSSKRYKWTKDELLTFLHSYVASRDKDAWLGPLTDTMRSRNPHLFDLRKD
jgi:3-deoxy-D-manno-octulosonic acid kinase